MKLIPWARSRRFTDDDFWAPLRRDWFRDLFDRDFFFMERPGEFSPYLDLTEDDQAYHVAVELPGIDPKDIDVSLEGQLLTIRGEKKSEREEKDRGYHRLERRYGSFSRSVHLPTEVDAGKIEADYRHGVLEIRLPKAETVKPKKIAVKVEN